MGVLIISDGLMLLPHSNFNQSRYVQSQEGKLIFYYMHNCIISMIRLTFTYITWQCLCCQYKGCPIQKAGIRKILVFILDNMKHNVERGVSHVLFREPSPTNLFMNICLDNILKCLKYNIRNVFLRYRKYHLVINVQYLSVGIKTARSSNLKFLMFVCKNP